MKVLLMLFLGLFSNVTTSQVKELKYKNFTGDASLLSYIKVFEHKFNPANVGGLTDLERINDSLYTAKILQEIPTYKYGMPNFQKPMLLNYDFSADVIFEIKENRYRTTVKNGIWNNPTNVTLEEFFLRKMELSSRDVQSI